MSEGHFDDDEGADFEEFAYLIDLGVCSDVELIIWGNYSLQGQQGYKNVG